MLSNSDLWVFRTAATFDRSNQRDPWILVDDCVVGLPAITVATDRRRLRSAVRDRGEVPRTTLMTCVFSEAGMWPMLVAV
jgi:hypothetical protein